jgi:hypothetical protein
MDSLSRELRACFAGLDAHVVFSAVEESPAGREPRSVTGQLDTANCLGSLTFWENGSAFMEVIAARDGRSMDRQQYEDVDLEKAQAVLGRFVLCVLEDGGNAGAG